MQARRSQTLGETGVDFTEASRQVRELKAAIDRNTGLFVQITEAAQILEAKSSGRVGVIFSFEAASMLEDRLDAVDHFAREGVKVMGLSYNKGSRFGGGTLQGPQSVLSPLGREAVARMASRGVTVDLSHSNEATSFDALAVAIKPMLITHAGSAAVHPHPRNKSDRLLKAVADAGGVTGVYDLSYLSDYPRNPSLETYLRHLTHMLDVCGEDGVGIGSDSVLLGMDTSPAAVAAQNKHEAERRSTGVAAPEELAINYVVGLNAPDRCEVICRAPAPRLRRAHGGEGPWDKLRARVFDDMGAYT